MVTDSDILELMQNAARAEEPEAGRVGDKLEGDDEALPSVIHTIKSAGWSIIYDTETAEPSMVNNNWLTKKLGQKRPNGKPYFTTIKPSSPPKRGTHKCLLHPEHPNRDEWDRMGLPVCHSGNLISPYEVTQHMKKKHSKAWEAIEHERIERERKEDRDYQRKLAEALAGKAEIGTPEAPLYVSDKDKKRNKK